ncbi:hypothetical protein, partial [Bradyrhizobium sp. S69]|uniref:hypothetical protein n=1 Tax=Bradyrhizobium sp. S69 TaxID=1641856 RepID=UPI001AEE0AF4
MVIVVRDISSVLLHPRDRRTDHLHRRVLTGRQCVHDPVTGASAANEPSTGITGELVLPRFPRNRTYPRHAKIDAN